MTDSILPKGELIRRAVRWLSEQRQENRGVPDERLIEEAAQRYNLSPLDEQFLLHHFGRTRDESEDSASPSQSE